MVRDFNPHESYRFFLQEAVELLHTLEAGLLNLHQADRQTHFNNLMRTVHSLKGGAACVGLQHVETLAHEFEAVIKTIASGDVAIDAELEALLLQAYDCLKLPLIEEIQTGKSNPAMILEQAQSVWLQLAVKLSFPLSPPIPWFTEDLNRGIARLETILKTTNRSHIQTALRAQIEIFKGLGAIAQLPDLVTTAQVALRALQTQPDEATSIGHLVLDEFRAIASRTPPPTPPLQSPAQSPAQSPSPPLLPLPPTSQLEPLNPLIEELTTQENHLNAQVQQQGEAIAALSTQIETIQRLLRQLARQEGKIASSIERSPGQAERSLKWMMHGSAIHLESLKEEFHRVDEIVQDLSLSNQQSQELLKQRQKTVKQAQNTLMQAQMLPVSELLKAFPRLVRDLAMAEGKQAILEITGLNPLVDQTILEKLYDLLVHLIRNALAHGIELPQVRQVLGKLPTGVITLHIGSRGNQIQVQVQDDGQGIDFERLRVRLAQSGLLAEEDAIALPDYRLSDWLFAPGFSTQETVSPLAGRGMGLYAVQSQLAALQGSITVESRLGKGTTFTLQVPANLAIARLLIFTLHRYLFALPVDSVVAITHHAKLAIQTQSKQQFYQWRGQFIPIFPVAYLSAYRYPLSAQSVVLADATTESGALLLIAYGNQVVALPVDQVLSEQELRIKPFNDAIAAPNLLTGCTILANGSLALVLDGVALVEQAQELATTTASPTWQNLVPRLMPTILVVDDSLTIRHALSSTLTRAGYAVVEAKDGLGAIAQLQRQPEIVAIICDIEMPRLNGLEFLSRYRQIDPIIPIIMLTYRRAEQYQQLAMHLGATAYITKPYSDKELLSALKSCLARLARHRSAET